MKVSEMVVALMNEQLTTDELDQVAAVIRAWTALSWRSMAYTGVLIGAVTQESIALKAPLATVTVPLTGNN